MQTLQMALHLYPVNIYSNIIPQITELLSAMLIFSLENSLLALNK